MTAPFKRLSLLVLFALLCGVVTVLAGNSGAPPPAGYRFSHPLTNSPSPSNPRQALAMPETLRILAAMVGFQEDNDDRTSGKGSFDLSTPAKRYIDMPPHNQKYFEDHLTFAKNYFEKSSNGRFVVLGTVLAGVYTLPKQMSAYSPSRTSATNPELGAFVADSWHLVDSLTPGIPYEQYQLFALFHAGAGHDIDFISIYGYDPTPFDIPSLYMGMPSLKKIYGDAYQGIPVRNGAYHLQNSMILPESETREVSGIGGTALLKLGINGLLVASIGSYKELPDLFDTKTGASGIGRFGLMDGQSIFSWNGVFPPEPSAWEKQQLGWATPIVVSPGSAVCDLPAASLSTSSDTIWRVPISNDEYFLVENRNRDAHNDGATVTIATPSGTIQKSWPHDTSAGFNAFNQDSLYGVVTDVDEFDWSLPGGVNTRTGEFFTGGTLIWHIDESVIDAKVAANEVNADPEHRGVNLMEADGSQDIGQSYGLLNAGSGSEEGTQLDFWYSGNQAPLRFGSGNRFTPTSFPSSKSNYGGNSHVVIRDFTIRQPRMQARIILGDSLVRPVAGFPKAVGSNVLGSQSVKFGQIQTGSGLFFGTGTSVFGWDPSGNPLRSNFDPSGLLASFVFPNATANITGPVMLSASILPNQPDLVFLNNGVSTLGSGRFANAYGFRLEDLNSDDRIDPFFSASLTGASGSPLLTSDYTAWADTSLKSVDLTGANPKSISIGDSIVGVSAFGSNDSREIVVGRNGIIAIVDLGASPAATVQKQFSGTYSNPAVSGSISLSAGKRIVFVSDDGTVHATDQNLVEVSNFPVATGGRVFNAPALADLDGDGSREIILFSGNKIWAISATGAILNNFPIMVHGADALLSSPVVGDIDQNGAQDIVAVTPSGLIVAYDKNAKQPSGFPVQSGPNNGSTPAIFSSIPPACLACRDTVTLAVGSSDGNVYAYRIGAGPAIGGAVTGFPWPQYMHDAQNSGFEGYVLTTNSPVSSFFPAGSAYNWPNPVGPADGYKTHIRYFVGADASVTVKIFDLAGSLVTTIEKHAQGGMDNEFEWDVTGIQSGVYFAHIEAQGAGQQGSAIIKIAVIK